MAQGSDCFGCVFWAAVLLSLVQGCYTVCPCHRGWGHHQLSVRVHSVSQHSHCVCKVQAARAAFIQRVKIFLVLNYLIHVFGCRLMDVCWSTGRGGGSAYLWINSQGLEHSYGKWEVETLLNKSFKPTTLRRQPNSSPAPCQGQNEAGKKWMRDKCTKMR